MPMTTAAHPRRTKIVATVGPATWDLPKLKQIIRAGANVLRINAAHNDIETRWHIVNTARQAARETGCRVALLQDLAGLKPRTGPLPAGETVSLAPGRHIELVPGDEPLRPDRISIEDPGLVAQLEPGQRVL